MTFTSPSPTARLSPPFVGPGLRAARLCSRTCAAAPPMASSPSIWTSTSTARRPRSPARSPIPARYSSGQSGDTTTAGLIDEAGSFAGITSPLGRPSGKYSAFRCGPRPAARSPSAAIRPTLCPLTTFWFMARTAPCPRRKFTTAPLRSKSARRSTPSTTRSTSTKTRPTTRSIRWPTIRTSAALPTR